MLLTGNELDNFATAVDYVLAAGPGRALASVPKDDDREKGHAYYEVTECVGYTTSVTGALSFWLGPTPPTCAERRWRESQEEAMAGRAKFTWIWPDASPMDECREVFEYLVALDRDALVAAGDWWPDTEYSSARILAALREAHDRLERLHRGLTMRTGTVRPRPRTFRWVKVWDQD